jgi:hypothetical protein
MGCTERLYLSCRAGGETFNPCVASVCDSQEAQGKLPFRSTEWTRATPVHTKLGPYHREEHTQSSA